MSYNTHTRDVQQLGLASLSDAWGVGQHLEHRSSGLSESDVLFLWLLCAGGKCFDHLQAHQTLDQPAYASMRA